MAITHRPSFDFLVAHSPEDAATLLRQKLASTDLPLKGTHLRDQCEIQVVDARAHVWSPHMSVIFSPAEQGARVRGHVGPNLPIWSLFLTAYSVLGILLVSALMFGYSQWSIHQSPSGMIAAALCAILLLVVFAVGKIGEKLAESQTLMMHHFLRDVLHPLENLP